MSLVPCPECGKEISSDAAKCPQCGGQTQKGKDRMKFIGFLLLVGLVGGTIWLAQRPSARERYNECVMSNLAHEYNHEPTKVCEAP